MVTGNVLPQERLLFGTFEGNGDFRMKLSKCNKFGLYMILSKVLFSFYFLILYKSRQLLKIVCF